MTNILADDYRRRIDWIEASLKQMVDPEGKVAKVDIERVIFQRFRCSESAVRRYLRTLEGAGIITQNSVYLIVEEMKPEVKK